ncbi:MAG TPA: hypothetical protein VI873_03010 [Candidatus Peribacteraceae bacterium]|nr:hypothetical protein [Candidatus Peribacteraceae bacterium]
MLPKEIVGHSASLAQLTEDIESGNVVHAYLFTGPKHLGKFTVAQWFARRLLTVGSADDEARTRVWDQMDRLIHPDYFQLDQLWMEDVCEDMAVIGCTTNIPQKHRQESKAKLNEISIDDVRALHERLHEIGSGQFRCCIIRSAERMRDSAGNAFLKMLEEPPKGMVFLLTSEFPTLLLPTLLSRTRQLRFTRLSQEELRPLVASMPPDDAQFLLRLAQGAPGVVQRLKTDPEALRKERMKYTQASDFWRTTSTVERLQMLKPLHDRSDESDTFLLHLSLALREQGEGSSERHSTALHQLIRGLKTNAQRKLLAQQFALAVTG